MINNDAIIVCSNCVLDSTIQNISFNENGVCNFCSGFFIENARKPRRDPNDLSAGLTSVIEVIRKKGQGKRYDCIIGLSGGVDSSYLAWLVRKHNLRPLAVHLDNGWNSELAVSNMEKVCSKLQIDLVTHVIDWVEFRDIQLSFLKASVAHVDAPTDHAIFATLYMFAKKYGIKYILDGINTNTEYTRNDMMDAGYNYMDYSQIKGIHKKFGKEPFITFPRMTMFMKFINQAVFGIRQLSLLNIIDYNKLTAIETLKKEIQWKPYDGKHHESLYTKWHQLVYLPSKFKFDIRKLHLSDLVLSGQLSREQALAELARISITAIEKKELTCYVQKKLGLSESEYVAMLTTTRKTYRDYPNSKWLLNIFQRLKKFLAKNVKPLAAGPVLDSLSYIF
ncbi:MAG: N-acetyl sugar amidotransferase [Bacteroidota bacterium]